jgi:hypothetical protein
MLSNAGRVLAAVADLIRYTGRPPLASMRVKAQSTRLKGRQLERHPIRLHRILQRRNSWRIRLV